MIPVDGIFFIAKISKDKFLIESFRQLENNIFFIFIFSSVFYFVGDLIVCPNKYI